MSGVDVRVFTVGAVQENSSSCARALTSVVG